MTQAQINRRRALAVVAAVPVAAALATPALASVGEDAELLRLWGELKAARAELGRLFSIHNAAEEAAFAEYGPRWSLVGVEYLPSRAVFVCGREGLVKVVPLRGKEPRSLRDQAAKVEASLAAEHEQTKGAAKKRHKVNSAERAANRCMDRVGELQHQIAETPAEGLTGIAIKLAVCVQERDFMQEPATSLVASAQEAAARIAGMATATGNRRIS